MKFNVADIEYEIEKRFVLSLRKIFEFDDRFIYNKDEKITKIVITSEYPEKDAPLKTPHIVVAGISYQFDMQRTFYGNYNDLELDSSGKIVIGENFVNVVPYSLSIICLGELFSSKDLANKVVNYITLAARDVFDGLNLNIASVGKGASGARSQQPEKIFETNVSVQGHVQWNGSVKAANISELNILREIKKEIEMNLYLKREVF